MSEPTSSGAKSTLGSSKGSVDDADINRSQKSSISYAPYQEKDEENAESPITVKTPPQ